MLTVAHCVQPGATYKIVEYGADKQPQLRDVQHRRHPSRHSTCRRCWPIAPPPTWRCCSSKRRRRGKLPPCSACRSFRLPAGSRFTIAGVGVTIRGEGSSAGTVRVAGLVATGRPGTLQIRLVDPVGQGTRAGLGACTGDSGGPVFEDRPGGPAIVGVISWSTGPNGSAGCGGLTGVTPLTLYRDWILQTARQWGFVL